MNLDIILIILALLLFAELAFSDRKIALVLFIFLLPTYLIRFSIPLPIGPIQYLPTTLLEMFFWLLFISWLLFGRQSPTNYSWRRWMPGLLMLLIGSLIGIAIAPDKISALGLWRAYFLEPILFLFIFVDEIREAKHRKYVLGALGGMMAIIGVIAIIQKITGWWIPNPVWVPVETRRVTAFYGFPNGIGLFCAPIVVLMTAWTVHLITKIKKVREAIYPFLTGVTAVLGIGAIVFAVSEGAIIGLAVGFLFLGLLMKPLRAVTLGAIIAVCALIIFYAPLRTYVSTLASMRDDSWFVRKIVWTESLDMLEDYKIFGAGLDGYQTALVPYHQAKHIEIFKYPHSILLNFWTETGVIGVSGFIALVFAFFITTGKLVWQRSDEWLPLALFSAMIAVLVHGLVDVPYFKNDLAILFLLLIGLVESMRRQEPENIKK